MKLDLIMILSGEDTKLRHRSQRAIQMFSESNGDTPILVSGSHSGFLGRTLPKEMKRECHQVADFLLSQGVPKRMISCEEQSLDTLGNFYFSRQLIGADQREIALITDPFHMGRSRYCAELVFGDSKHFNPEPTNNPRSGSYTRFIEWIQKVIVAKDMKKLGVERGDYSALSRFMEKAHPFYSKDTPEKSLYGRFIALFRGNMALAKFFLPTQRQAYND